MRRIATTAACAWMLALPVAHASDFDGSKALICAPVQVHECVAADKCLDGTPREVGTPTFLRIDFANRTIVGPHRTTPFRYTESGEGQMLLLGTELGFAWTVALDRDTGDMTATLADRNGVFVMFGSCIAP